MIPVARIRLSTLATTLTLLSACGSEDSPDDSPVDPGPTTTTSDTGPAGSPSMPVGPGGGATGPGASGPSGPSGPSGGASGPSGPGASGMAGSSPGAGGGPSAGGASGAAGASPSATGGAGGTALETGGAGAGGTSGGGGAAGSGGTPGAAGSAGMNGGGAGGEPTVTSPLPPVEDYSALGPYDTTSQANTGPDGTYTVVRPEALGEDGFLHAPITFGPGTGMQVSQMMGLLERFASHGFVVIGRQLEGGPGDPVTRMRMTAGLDWIIEQNSTSGSVFEGMIDVDHAVAMGYSVGGTGAVEIGGHEAIATVVSIHGHGAEGDLHAPLLLIGGTDDVMGDGLSWLAPTYEASQVQTFFGTVIGADHGYIQGTVGGVPGGVETPAMIAWMRYWIYNDQEAKAYFEGDDCVMCDDPWTNPQRKNWP